MIINPSNKFTPSVNILNSLRYVLRFSLTALFKDVSLLFVSYPNTYRFTANGLFFSLTFDFLFDKNFSLLSADQFIKDYLIEKLKINHIIIGYDHRFGKGREASVDDLKKYGESFDFIVEEIKAHEVESIAVSSTKIRDSINSGNLDKSAKFLGRFFKITGKVIKGDGLGKQINYPTANLYVEENYKIIPKDGVYFIKTLIDNKEFHGMMNIGHRPTIGENKKSIEVHLFDFNKDIYDKTISVDVVLKIRDEIKFSSIEALKEQLKKDETYCNQLINK